MFAVRRSLLSVALVGVMVSVAAAEVKFANIFQSHMVLQREKKVAVWGWADAGEKVTVSFAGKMAQVTANSDGRWQAKLGPFEAGGPHELVAKGSNEVKLADVLVGEVWICSGQSNMEWPVTRALNPDEEIKNANHPQIRHIKIGRATPGEPAKDSTGTWTVCNPEVVGGYTAVGYFFGRALQKELNVPIGLVNTSWGGTICEAWTSQEALAKDKDFAEIIKRGAAGKQGNPNRASVLYNGMVAPLIPLSIRGAIWYQGESNRSRAAQYAKLFPTMITDWRNRFGQGDFAFLFVQLAPYQYGKSTEPLLAEIWESQLKTLELPNTGMAVTTDIGNIRDIHPKNKQEVGRRLALWALATTYGKDELVYSGPLFKSAKVDGDKIRISFDHVGGGLVSGDGEPLTHFTIAGKDEEFVEAKAVIEGNEVVVSSDDVKNPVAVRFGWVDTAEPNLANKEGLPASPFRTDDRKLISAGKL